MIDLRIQVDEEAAAKLLWQVKAIATKEFESLTFDSRQNIFTNDVVSVTSEDSAQVYELSDRRKRTVSIESMDMLSTPAASPKLSSKTISLIDPSVTDSPGAGSYEDFALFKRVTSPSSDDSLSAASLTSSPTVLITQKYGKRKRESYVGLATKGGSIRATLRKKFSWKQFPEVSACFSVNARTAAGRARCIPVLVANPHPMLAIVIQLEEYLISNQDEYFEFSSRNYTAEQRKYNNGLTRGLLDLAAEEGYVFEEFTFSMVRDRIRCYYKSHSQSCKKKRRR